jgi:hypothetical protein
MRITLGANSKDCKKDKLERGEEESSHKVKINTNKHNDLFPEVRFQ